MNIQFSFFTLHPAAAALALAAVIFALVLISHRRMIARKNLSIYRLMKELCRLEKQLEEEKEKNSSLFNQIIRAK